MTQTPTNGPRTVAEKADVARPDDAPPTGTPAFGLEVGACAFCAIEGDVLADLGR